MPMNLLLVLAFIVQTFQLQSQSVEKPEVFVFGESKDNVVQKIMPLCTSTSYHENERIQLPTAKKIQSQLDCEGFMYYGKPRKVELVFADEILDMVWILTDEAEEQQFIAKFKEMYGEPSHMIEDATFFLNHGVAVRNKPHEVLFISERLKKPYEQFLNNKEWAALNHKKSLMDVRSRSQQTFVAVAEGVYVQEIGPG